MSDEATNNELTEQLKELNTNLRELRNSGKHMLYSASPAKFAVFNFISGIFHSLGSLFAYVFIFGVLAYLFAQLNLPGLMSGFVEKTLDNVNWDKIMPAPKLPENSGLDIDFDKLDIKSLEEQLQKQ